MTRFGPGWRKGLLPTTHSACYATAVEAGVARERARPLALSVLAILEGSFLLCRSLRSTEPMSASSSSDFRRESWAKVASVTSVMLRESLRKRSCPT